MDTGTAVPATLAPRAVADAIEWWSDADDAPRHAFLLGDHLPGRSLCALGLRWTARWGKHGNGTCQGCLVALREQIRRASVALQAVESADLALGDHHVGIGL